MVDTRDLRQQIINYGKPKTGDIVALSQKVLKGTSFIEESVALTSIRFFTGRETQDSFWNNHKFPLTETCMDILGIRLTHNLCFTSTPPEIANKWQQVFEQTSFLRVKYRQRSERINLNASLLTESSIIATGNTATGYAKAGSVHQCGFYMLKNPLQVGGQQDIEWLLDIQSGFTTAANDVLAGDATPVMPNTGLVGGAGYFVSLELLVEEKGEAAI
jgi:hypothetical protein